MACHKRNSVFSPRRLEALEQRRMLASDLDVNQDGEIVPLDGLLVVNAIVSEDYTERADVNHDGVVDDNDLAAILDALASERESLVPTAEVGVGCGGDAEMQGPSDPIKVIEGGVGCGEMESTTSSYSVDMIVYSGDEGKKVEQTEEDTIGAITVANLNDTNGDGIMDLSQSPVIATSNGNDEDDLLRVQVNRPTGYDGGLVRLSASGANASAVVFWNSPRKEGLLGDTVDLDFSGPGASQTVYAELMFPSATNGDITLNASYKGASDSVLATAIWVTKESDEFDWRTHGDFVGGNVPGFDIPDDLPWGFDVEERLDEDDGTGLKRFAVGESTRYPQGAIVSSTVFKFKVYPEGAHLHPHVTFDVTRRKKEGFWVLDESGTVKDSGTEDFPPGVDEPNDDNTNDDEDYHVVDGKLFSQDSPGIEYLSTQLYEPYDETIVVKTNFEEFVRVKFNGEQFDERVNGFNYEDGTRASLKVKWHEALRIKEINGEYRRVDDQGNVTGEGENGVTQFNFIKLGSHEDPFQL